MSVSLVKKALELSEPKPKNFKTQNHCERKLKAIKSKIDKRKKLREDRKILKALKFEKIRHAQQVVERLFNQQPQASSESSNQRTERSDRVFTDEDFEIFERSFFIGN